MSNYNCFIFFIMISLIAPQLACAQGITIAANPIIHSQYSKWEDKHDFTTPPNFSNMKAHRGEVELALICMALRRGGFTDQINVTVVPNYSRALLSSKQGKTTMPAETVWDSEVDQNAFYRSVPILEEGSIELGIYALPSNASIMKVKTLHDLQRFTAVSSINWVKDWDTLIKMGIKTYDVPKQELMFRTVAAHRVDFLLTKFSADPELEVYVDGVAFIAVPNIKVGLQGARSFVVSKEAPNSKAVFECLQKGLHSLRDEGTVYRAYVESGFINAKVKNWKRIHP